MTKQESKIKQMSITKEYYTPQEQKIVQQQQCKEKYTIGVPEDTFIGENRVCLTPHAVEMLTLNKHTVYIEKGAGIASGFSDKDYVDSGAILSTKKKTFSANIVLKISPLCTEEIEFLSPEQFIISTLQAHTRKAEDIKKMMKKKTTALAVEHIKDKNNFYPVVRSISEIAGVVSIHIAAEYLSKSKKGILLGGITGIPPAEVVILGAGTAGEYASKAAMGLGATVKVFDFSTYRLKQFIEHLGTKIFTSIFNPYILSESLLTADVVLGALHFVDDEPRMVVTEDMIKKMKTGSVIVDLTIDKGGCFETSRPTTHIKPTYIEHGITHYCVPNITSLVPRTASIALSNIFASLVLKISANGGISQMTSSDEGFRNGIYLFRGILTNPHLGKKLDIVYRDINLLLAAF